MFTFFKYKNGEPIPFRKLRYSDIENFINDDWEEGYTIEFKESFDSSVKSKIPAIFTSFANSEGGLLIIGIKDNKKLYIIFFVFITPESVLLIKGAFPITNSPFKLLFSFIILSSLHNLFFSQFHC